MPLLPDPIRRLAIFVVLVAAAVVALLGTRFAGHTAPSRVDTAVDTRLAFRLGGHPGLLDRFVSLGAPVTVIATTLILVLAMGLLRPGRAVVFAASAPGLASGVTELILKPLIGRTKGAGLAFPSGHTTGAFSLALVIAVVVIQPGTPRIPFVVRLLLGLGAVVVAGGTAIALVALRYHYATDTIGGVGVALAVVLTVALTLDLIGDRLNKGETSVSNHRKTGILTV